MTVLTPAEISEFIDRAFAEDMARHGVPVTRWAKGENSYQTGEEAARALLARPGIDGIFGVTDEIALGVLNTARAEMGRRVPDDLSVIGFDDAPVSAWASHGLTTVAQSLEALTAASTAALTVYDMVKAADRGMEIGGLRVLLKDGGKSGRYEAE